MGLIFINFQEWSMIPLMFGIYKTRTTLVFALIHVIRKCNLNGSMYKSRTLKNPSRVRGGKIPSTEKHICLIRMDSGHGV